MLYGDQSCFDRVLLEAMVDVDFLIDDPPEEMHNGKHYPVTIVDVSLRGKSILNLLHVSHVMMLQRRVWLNWLEDNE